MNRVMSAVESDKQRRVAGLLMYEPSVSHLKTAFGQALITTFRKILLVFLQALQDTPITRLHCKTEPF